MSDTTNIDFADALAALKGGKSVARSGWNGKGMFITLQTPTEQSKMTRPYLFMTIPAGTSEQFGTDGNKEQLVPWIPSQRDLLVSDWFVL